MELLETLKSKNVQELEEWFLGAVSGEKLPVDEMLAVLLYLKEMGTSNQLDDCVTMMADTLVERGDANSVLRLLENICGWHGRAAAFRAKCATILRAVYRDRLSVAFLESIALETDLDLCECLRRFRCMLGLKPGVLCLDKTWGFGSVREVDDFYKKVTIDFSVKRGHQMSFAYAGETLQILDESHILVRKHRNPAEVATMAGKEPGRLVKLVLASYGSVNSVRLKELIVPEFVADADWKTFWDAARKALKADTSVVISSGRNDPIRLLSGGAKTADERLKALSAERDVARVLDLIDEMSAAGQLDVSRDDARAVLIDRLAFVAKAARGRQFATVARVVIRARAMLRDEHFDTVPLVETTLAPAAYQSVAIGLSAREMKQYFSCLRDGEKAKVIEMLPGALPELPFKITGEAIDYLASQGAEAQVVTVLQDLVAMKTAGVDVLFWLARHTDRMATWKVGSQYDLFKLIIDSFGVELSGERLKIQNQLFDVVEDKEWLDAALAAMDSRQRADILHRANASASWDQSRKRSVMARMIKLHPELGKVVAGDSDETAKPPMLTSWRSFREKQAQYKKLVEVDIPQNSKDIGVARSYGDLRENYEYKAAKEMQGVLLRRQAQLEIDLKEVKATDFAGVPTAQVGAGTCITIELADGSLQRYCILGEWDRDETLGIIGSGSKVAEVLAGHRKGDRIRLPRGTGEEECRIVEVSGLTDDIKAWMAG
ncbi:MAG: hypothetical protein C0404_04160 [Verrucomicrobia bacterium]|nr:hypothetical protein [Verrucomicrobiota bacterium]